MRASFAPPLASVALAASLSLAPAAGHAAGGARPNGSTAQRLTVQFSPVVNAGVSGAVTLTALPSATRLSWQISGLTPGTSLRGILRAGTCAQPSASFRVLATLMADATGRATATTTTDLPLSLLADGDHTLAIGTVACGDIPALGGVPAPGVPAATTTGAATPIQAVATLLAPFAAPGPPRGACDAVTGRVQGCPITPRLRYRLEHFQAGENGNIVGRTQNPPRSLRWAQIGNNGFVARVNTRWDYGASNSYAITFVVARQDDGWRVDDAYCAGRPQTSIYNPPAGPCA